MFWATLVAAVGTVAAVAVSLLFAYRARSEDRRKAVIAEAARIEAQALVLRPGPGVMWWIVRAHEPAVTINYLFRMRLHPGDKNPQHKDSMFFEHPQHMDVNTRYGVGVGLAVGDYVEVSWTEDGTGREWINGARIGDANAVHFISNDQHGH